jgi:hypothetical protein
MASAGKPVKKVTVKMNEQQAIALLPLVAPVVTLIVVMLGVFFSNRHVDVRISDVTRLITSESGRLEAVMKAESAAVRLELKTESTAIRRDLQDRIDVLTTKVVDVDNRVIRIEDKLGIVPR